MPSGIPLCLRSEKWVYKRSKEPKRGVPRVIAFGEQPIGVEKPSHPNEMAELFILGGLGGYLHCLISAQLLS